MSAEVQTPLELAQQFANAVSSVKSASLSEYTQAARLTPMALIDSRVLAVDRQLLTALSQTLLSIYSGYYLLAVNMAATVGNVKVMRILDQFATNRDLVTSIGNSAFWANEEIDDTASLLPSYGLETEFASYGVGLGEQSGNKPYDNSKTIAVLNDASNLAVGKVLDVRIAHGEHSVTIPVTVTLNPKTIEPEDLVSVVTNHAIDRTWKGRYRAWRSGEIKFFRDYLMCQDLIEADQKALMADKTGSLLAARSTRTKGIFAALLSGYASPNAVSAMYVVSKQTAFEMELALKGKFKSSHTRNEFFKANSAMMLVVVDAQMERFTLYQRGIADFRDYTMDDIKGNASKPNGVDINQIMKAYNAGNEARL